MKNEAWEDMRSLKASVELGLDVIEDSASRFAERLPGSSICWGEAGESLRSLTDRLGGITGRLTAPDGTPCLVDLSCLQLENPQTARIYVTFTVRPYDLAAYSKLLEKHFGPGE